MEKNIHSHNEGERMLERRVTTHTVMGWKILLKISERAVWNLKWVPMLLYWKKLKSSKMIKPLGSALKNTVLLYIMFVQNKHQKQQEAWLKQRTLKVPIRLPLQTKIVSQHIKLGATCAPSCSSQPKCLSLACVWRSVWDTDFTEAWLSLCPCKNRGAKVWRLFRGDPVRNHKVIHQFLPSPKF